MLGLAPKENQKIFSSASPVWEGLLGPSQQAATGLQLNKAISWDVQH